MALQTAKQAFEQQRTQELQQVMGAMHFLHCGKSCDVISLLGYLSSFEVLLSLHTKEIALAVKL